jgi:hypothetical protein
MAVVVGTCTMMALRVLGVASEMPLAAFGRAPRLVWSGFTVNAATGFALFAIDAEHKATQGVFYVKLACIALALVCYTQIRRRAFAVQGGADASPGGGVKGLAVLSLVLWTGATVAGRLMAYLI